MRLLTLCAGLSRSWRKWIAVRESPDCPALTQKGDRFICGGKGRKEMVSSGSGLRSFGFELLLFRCPRALSTL